MKPSPPARLTAAASRPPLMPAMGAQSSGWRMPSKVRSVDMTFLDSGEQAFYAHRFAHCRTRGHPHDERLQVRQVGDIQLRELCPAKHDEQVGIGSREDLAREVERALQLPVQ